MNTNQDYTMLNVDPMCWLIRYTPAAKELYRILAGKECTDLVCPRVVRRSNSDFCYYSFDMLVLLRNDTKHSLTIRLLDRLEDLSKYYEHPLGDIYEYYDEQGELCFNIPYTQLMVYFLRSGELPGGKVVCRAGFPTGVDDLEDYRPEMPTMIISTTGEGDGGEISRLARYLRHPEPGMPQFGPIGRVVERWIGENSNAAERSNDG